MYNLWFITSYLHCCFIETIKKDLFYALSHVYFTLSLIGILLFITALNKTKKMRRELKLFLSFPFKSMSNLVYGFYFSSVILPHTWDIKLRLLCFVVSYILWHTAHYRKFVIIETYNCCIIKWFTVSEQQLLFDFYTFIRRILIVTFYIKRIGKTKQKIVEKLT